MVRGLGVDAAVKFSAIVKGCGAHYDVHHAGQAHAAPNEGHSDGGKGYEGARRQIWRRECAPGQDR